MLISVIVPVYNVEKYLSNCIESILEQSYKNIELLLIDDGSNDNSLQVCNSYKMVDNRVKVFHIENSGVSNARNIGLKYATGDYVCFVDADDILLFDYIEKLYSLININNCSVVYSNYKLYFSDNKIVEKNSRINDGLYEVSKLKSKLIDDGTLTGLLFGSVCCSIYDMNIIRNNNISFDSDIKINEDGIFNLSFLKYVDKLYFSSYSGYLYRQWKVSKIDDLIWNCELDKATIKIKKEFSEYENIQVQLAYRAYSILFWNSITVSRMRGSCFKVAKKLKKMINGNFNFELLEYECDFSLLSTPKKVLLVLLLKRHYILFCFMMKRLYPIFNKILKH